MWDQLLPWIQCSERFFRCPHWWALEHLRCLSSPFGHIAWDLIKNSSSECSALRSFFNGSLILSIDFILLLIFQSLFSNFQTDHWEMFEIRCTMTFRTSCFALDSHHQYHHLLHLSMWFVSAYSRTLSRISLSRTFKGPKRFVRDRESSRYGKEISFKNAF